MAADTTQWEFHPTIRILNSRYGGDTVKNSKRYESPSPYAYTKWYLPQLEHDFYLQHSSADWNPNDLNLWTLRSCQVCYPLRFHWARLGANWEKWNGLVKATTIGQHTPTTVADSARDSLIYSSPVHSAHEGYDWNRCMPCVCKSQQDLGHCEKVRVRDPLFLLIIWFTCWIATSTYLGGTCLAICGSSWASSCTCPGWPIFLFLGAGKV